MAPHFNWLIVTNLMNVVNFNQFKLSVGFNWGTRFSKAVPNSSFWWIKVKQTDSLDLNSICWYERIMFGLLDLTRPRNNIKIPKSCLRFIKYIDMKLSLPDQKKYRTCTCTSPVRSYKLCAQLLNNWPHSHIFINKIDSNMH